MDEQLKKIRTLFNKTVYKNASFTEVDRAAIRQRLQNKKKKRYWIPNVVIVLFFISFAYGIYFFFTLDPDEPNPQFATQNQSNSDLYIARKRDLINTIFTDPVNPGNTLIFTENELSIITDPSVNAIKPDVDPSELKNNAKTEVIYKNIKIKTSGDKYFITGDNAFSLELKKVGQRIIADPEGNEYSTSIPLD